MPKISVIIPVYNTEKYLPVCLDSVLNQNFKDIEVICINDGSIDRSGDILKKYAEKDKRVKVLTQKNKGQSAARNAGLEIVQGQWITFVDSDDALPPNALSILWDIAEQTSVKIVASRARFTMYEEPLREFPKQPHGIHYRIKTGGLADFVQDNRIFSSPWNKLFQADLFRKIRFPEGMVFEDWPIMTILFGQIDSYATTDIPCYVYRENNTSTTRSSFTQRKVDCYLRGIRIVYDAFKETDKIRYAQTRIAVAIKMVVNKVYHVKDHALSSYTLTEINKLFAEHVISKNRLPLKTRWRLWQLKHQ